MPTQEQKRPSSSLPNADPGSVIIFVNPSGEPSTKDEDGEERSLVRSTPSIVWKNDTPGSPFVAGDTVDAEFDTIIMLNVADPDVVTINLPAITVGSAGKGISIRNLVNKKGGDPGFVVVTPSPADIIESNATGQAVYVSPPIVHLTLESDGVGRWNSSSLGGGLGLFPPYPPSP